MLEKKQSSLKDGGDSSSLGIASQPITRSTSPIILSSDEEDEPISQPSRIITPSIDLPKPEKRHLGKRHGDNNIISPFVNDEVVNEGVQDKISLMAQSRQRNSEVEENNSFQDN